MKIGRYNNNDLREALSDRNIIIQEAYNMLTDAMYDADDAQLDRFNRYMKLPQFERDLLVLTSKLPVSHIAELYGVTSSYIYIRLKRINKILDESTTH